MTILVGILGLLIIAVILWDGFETIILPRRVTRAFRITRLFYRSTWMPYSAVARRIRDLRKREAIISYFGPLSLILLLIFWAVCLMFGFSLVQWAFGSPGKVPFASDLDLSVSSFLTLVFSNINPLTAPSRLIALVEGGVGYGFLALVIGYLPALTGAFSRREVNVSMLDERAGSPPTAFRLLARCQESGGKMAINQFLWDWERWVAELMESHLSYPVLAYFRSQHDNQSWVAALAMVLDLCALIITGIDGLSDEPARLTFAIARHAAVDLTQVFNTPPNPPVPDRLPPAELAHLREHLAAAGVRLRQGAEADHQLTELRAMYEPYLNAMASLLIVTLPPWLPEADHRDNWETTAWERFPTLR